MFGEISHKKGGEEVRGGEEGKGREEGKECQTLLSLSSLLPFLLFILVLFFVVSDVDVHELYGDGVQNHDDDNEPVRERGQKIHRLKELF